MFLAEKKLAVEVAKVYGIEINYVDRTKPCEDEVFQKFAADTSGTDKKYFALDSLESIETLSSLVHYLHCVFL